jgi:hypothetical protein
MGAIVTSYACTPSTATSSPSSIRMREPELEQAIEAHLLAAPELVGTCER